MKKIVKEKGEVIAFKADKNLSDFLTNEGAKIGHSKGTFVKFKMKELKKNTENKNRKFVGL